MGSYRPQISRLNTWQDKTWLEKKGNFNWSDVCGTILVKALNSIIIVNQVDYSRVQKLGGKHGNII